MSDYQKYQEYLGPVPVWLEKYLKLDILTRLKDISVLCGMDYASKYAYDFAFYISRFDHSLNVALITWRLTNDKKATLAALTHDVASPVFSHVIDYMNGDYLNQESTEEKTEQILRESVELRKCLELDEINIEDILDFKKYSVVDLDRPSLCADRLENNIGVGMCWVKELTIADAIRILSDVYVTKNENGVEEISFKTYDIALYFKVINDTINALTHTNEDTYMMMLLASIVERVIKLGIIRYDDLFLMGEHEMMEIIESHLDDPELSSKWDLFKNIQEFPTITQPAIKNKILSPLVLGKRID